MNNKRAQGMRNLRRDGARLILTEHGSVPYALKDERLGAVHFCAHNGTSMYPTVCESDLLEIEAYGDRPIRLGDVIFFMPPDGGRRAVHRVASVTPEGVRTKGDNNNRIDPWFIRSEDVIGQVVLARQGEKRRRIYGGRVGQLWSFWIRGLRVVEKGLSFFYHPLAQSGLLRRLVPLQKRMRIVAFRRNGERAFKLLLGNWMIGHYQPGMNAWQIRRPFRLFVDVISLPK